MHELLGVPEYISLYWADFETDSGGHHVFLLTSEYSGPREKTFLEAALRVGCDRKYVLMTYERQDGY